MNSSTEVTVTRGDRGDVEKILAMVVLGVGSFFAGMLPALISERNRRRFPLVTSLLLCIGAGILLATALVHILPEVRLQMPSNYAEISLCVGFFAIYFIDEFIHYFFGEAIQHTHSSATHSVFVPEAHISQQQQRSYGAVRSELEPLLSTQTTPTTHSSQTERTLERNPSCIEDSHGHSHANQCNDAVVAAANARICHTAHNEPCAQANITGTLGLFVALSLHSAVEGLAIGVQSSATKVLFLLGAVACHKYVMGFCLGLEFRSNPQASIRSQLIGISVFALGAVCGIGLGMAIVDVRTTWMKATLPIIQGLAGGTLLYVTVCEVIPREKARWHQNSAHKMAGFAQFLAVASGFTIMVIINMFLNDDES